MLDALVSNVSRWRLQAGRTRFLFALTVGLLLAAGSALAPAASAAPGDLDPSFSGDGLQRTNFSAGYDSAQDVVVQSDGKILAVGRRSADAETPSAFALARYNPDGSLDTTFSGDGKLITDLDPSDSGGDTALAVALQADGKIIAAGTANGGGGFGLARYNPDGSLDTTFSGDGLQVTDFGTFGPYAIFGVAVQADGKIVAVGDGGSGGFGLARYNPDGSLDPSFSGDGLQTTNIGAAATDVALQPDGRIVISGDAGFAVARYNPDGSLDPSFSGDGTQRTDFGGDFDAANSVALQADGKILAGGTGGTDGDFALARYNPDGSLDTTFSGDGKQITEFVAGSFDSVEDLAVQADGKIVAAGYGGPGLGLARYNPDGSLDPSFSGDGKLTTDVDNVDFAFGLTLQADGRIVVAGTAGNDFEDTDFLLARYLAADAPVDDTPPQTTITAGAAEGSTIGDRTPTFEFSSSEPGSTFRCRIDNGASFGCESPFTTGELSEGQHSFSVAATDAAGNTDPTPATRTFTVRINDPDPDPDPDPQPQPPATQPPAPQPPAPQAPVQSGPPVEGDPGYTYPAKLRVARAEVDREERKLDVFAPLTSRAFGDDVDVAFRAAGRTAKYNVSVTSGDAAFDRIRFKRTITREQADLGTGIVTIQYPGNEVTRPQEVRLRAASRQADLEVEEISLQGDRLSTSGMLDDRAKGVVRLELSYLDVQGRPQVFKTNAEIEDGEWSLENEQVPTEIAQRGAYVSVLFTGYFPRRIRGEMISYQIEPGQTRRPD